MTGLLLYVEARAADRVLLHRRLQHRRRARARLLVPTGQLGHPQRASRAARRRAGLRARTARRSPSRPPTRTAARCSLLTTNRTGDLPRARVQRHRHDVQRLALRVKLWAKLAPGQPTTQLRVSLQRNARQLHDTFHTRGRQHDRHRRRRGCCWRPPSTSRWRTRRSRSTWRRRAGPASFYIDDFELTFIPPPVAELDIAVRLPDHGPLLPGRRGGAAAPISSASTAVLLNKHFNSITSENDMKWRRDRADARAPSPSPTADAQVAFAKANGMQVRGHTLVWHAQTPAVGVQRRERHPDDADAGEPGPADPAHARATSGRWSTHFGTDVYTWDVVNEAIDQSRPTATAAARGSTSSGPEFIDIAFQAAREFAPDGQALRTTTSAPPTRPSWRSSPRWSAA